MSGVHNRQALDRLAAKQLRGLWRASCRGAPVIEAGGHDVGAGRAVEAVLRRLGLGRGQHAAEIGDADIGGLVEPLEQIAQLRDRQTRAVARSPSPYPFPAVGTDRPGLWRGCRLWRRGPAWRWSAPTGSSAKKRPRLQRGARIERGEQRDRTAGRVQGPDEHHRRDRARRPPRPRSKGRERYWTTSSATSAEVTLPDHRRPRLGKRRVRHAEDQHRRRPQRGHEVQRGPPQPLPRATTSAQRLIPISAPMPARSCSPRVKRRKSGEQVVPGSHATVSGSWFGERSAPCRRVLPDFRAELKPGCLGGAVLPVAMEFARRPAAGLASVAMASGGRRWRRGPAANDDDPGPRAGRSQGCGRTRVARKSRRCHGRRFYGPSPEGLPLPPRRRSAQKAGHVTRGIRNPGSGSRNAGSPRRCWRCSPRSRRSPPRRWRGSCPAGYPAYGPRCAS